MPDIEPKFFDSPPNLQSKFLERVRFRINLFNTRKNWIRIFTMCLILWMKICSGKSKFFEKLASKKSISLGHLTPWKRESWHFRAFSQIFILINFYEKGTYFQSNFSSSLTIWYKFFKTCEILDQGVQTCHKLSKKFNNCQNLTWKFKNVSDNQV